MIHKLIFKIYILILIPGTLISMSLEEKVGQLIVIPICPDLGESHVEKACNLIIDKKIGNVLFMRGTAERQLEITKILQNQSVRTFQDAECGVGMRLHDVPPLPQALTIGAIQDDSLLIAYGRELARQCRLHGIQGNFAPVADVNCLCPIPIMKMRSFGDDLVDVTTKVGLVLEGMRQGGLWACIKHFPGHGAALVDSHDELPVIEVLELFPFQFPIYQGVEMMMVGHLQVPEITDKPASLSSELMIDLLRDDMGFEGAIVTDALNMKALTTFGTLPELAVQSLLAGADLLLFADYLQVEMEHILSAIPKAIQQILDCVPEQVIDERLKHLQVLTDRSVRPIPDEVPHFRHTLFEAALTLIGKVPQIEGEVVVVGAEKYARLVDGPHFSLDQIEEASQYKNLIVCIGKGDLIPRLPRHAFLCLFDTPYRIYEIDHPNILVAYEECDEAFEAASKVLAGALTPRGKLPISIMK